MPMFSSLTFRRAAATPAPAVHGLDLPDHVRRALPMRFEAVGEALVSDADVWLVLPTGTTTGAVVGLPPEFPPAGAPGGLASE